VVSVDLYPQGANPTAALFERNENPSVDMKVLNTHEGPGRADINAMIGKLRGVTGFGAAGSVGAGQKEELPAIDNSEVEVRRAIPLRRGGVSFAPDATRSNEISR
jgi:hypothetical protein